MSTAPVIAGIDEAGRGPLAGPVVAAACVLPQMMFKRRGFGWSPFPRKQARDCLIGDSKQLSEAQREEAYEWIVANCAYGVGAADASEIDMHGILIATEKAMHLALGQLKTLVTPTYLLVDGCDAFWFDHPHSSVIRGDSLECCIAAASIIAKVTRDRMMKEWDSKWPRYGFAQHKGYGAQQHMDALREHGPCELHRQTFLKKFYEREPQVMGSVSVPSTTTELFPR
jgi:ribonuclease HII